MPITPTAVETLTEVAREIAESSNATSASHVRNILLISLENLDVRHNADFPSGNQSLRDRIAQVICNDDDWWASMSASSSSREYYTSMAGRVLSLVYEQR